MTFLKQLDKKFGPTNVVWGLCIVFVLLVLICLGFSGLGLKKIHRGSATWGMSQSAPSMGYHGGGMAMDSAYDYKMRVLPPIPSPIPPVYPSPGASTEELPFDKKVIQNGSLDVIVESAEETLSRISDIAKFSGGFVENSNIYEVSDDVKSGNVTVRVPKDTFDETMSAIKALALKLRNENVNSSDVTAYYVDLEAQLANLKEEEEQYREIMDRATKIEDVLNVTQRLAEVRMRIDNVQSQINGIGRQVDMSTIHVSLTSQAEVEVFGIVWKPLTQIKLALRALVNDFVSFINALIMIIFRLPVFLVKVGLVAFLAWIVWKIALWGKRLIVK